MFPLTPSQDPSDELWLRIDQLRAAAIFPDGGADRAGSGEPATAEDRHGDRSAYHRLPRRPTCR